MNLTSPNSSNHTTPMLRQYGEIKKQYPGTLLFFRLGDFYEMFYDDAVLASRELDITLTARHKETPNPVPMCGVPHHAAPQYIAKLVKKGYRVAICDQTEEAGNSKLVRRQVVRVITPGTALDEQILETGESRYLSAIAGAGDSMAVAFLDLSTGEFLVTEYQGDESLSQVINQIEQFGACEVLCPKSLEGLISPHIILIENMDKSSDSNENKINSKHRVYATLTVIENWWITYEEGLELLKKHFGVTTLDGFGLNGKRWSIGAAASILQYVQNTQMTSATHITEISYFEPTNFLQLDGATIRNLELIESIDGNKKETLFAILNTVETGMGARLLKNWLLRPSINFGELQTRLNAVDELFNQTVRRDKLRQMFSSVQDIERLLSRISLGTANPRDIFALRISLEALPGIKFLLQDFHSSLLEILQSNLDEMKDITTWITETLNDNPPIKLDEGNIIRSGFNSELDELRLIKNNAQGYIAEVERRERERTGINSLKIKFNNVFGYFIEISKANLKNVPEDYHRKQTLVNAERFTTPELKAYEEKVLGAEASILELETNIFQTLRLQIAKEIVRLQTAARIIATLDVLASFANLASLRNYVRPQLHESDELVILDGRHPVVESYTSRFVPNDVRLNNTTQRLVILTGPNMGGKSVYLRQTALLVLMAQIGSFVPAKEARLPILDRVFTRVGASDNLARGRSTFMVEMVETANILNTASPRSLVLLDEIGRGTATFDGLSLAWAVAEYLHNHPNHAAKTMFATHYHEMTELEKLLPGVKNSQVAVSASDGKLIFLHKVIPGNANKSYGIEVAKLAGLPASVITRANEILENLEANELDVLGKPKLARSLPSRKEWKKTQTTLFDKANEEVMEELRTLDLENISQEQAKNILAILQTKIV